jgi:hypothetical protein
MTQQDTIVWASKDTIDQYDTTAREFLKAIFGQDLSECLLTDESNLSDFATCGLPEALANQASTMNEAYQAWDDWVVPRVCAHYRIEPFDTRIRLIELFRLIETRTTQSLN